MPQVHANDLNRTRVLIVDDDSEQSEDLICFLEKHLPVNVTVVSTVSAAQDFLGSTAVDFMATAIQVEHVAERAVVEMFEAKLTPARVFFYSGYTAPLLDGCDTLDFVPDSPELPIFSKPHWDDLIDLIHARDIVHFSEIEI